MRTFRSNAFKGALNASGKHSLSNEAEDTSGQLKPEIEHMFYARVDDPKYLLKAMSMEIQEQWGIWQDKTEKNAGKGSVRVRKVISTPIIGGQFDNLNKTEQVIQTTKLKRSDGSSLEVSVEASEDALTAMRVMAESGMIKHRYRFPIPDCDLVWECDLFVEPGHSHYSTNYIGWCKCDLEVPDASMVVPPLPEGFLDGFNSKIANPTDIQKEVIELMSEFISLPNPYVKEYYPDVLPK